MTQAGDPANTPGTGDPGDDTFRRYRYQATYAAILSLGILRDDPKIEEIFCEHHEDILAKMRDGTYHGIQVKTRAPGGGPWKTNDQDMSNSIARFVDLEGRFPGRFSRYTIATNHQFYIKDNGQSIPYLAKCAREATGHEPGEMNSVLSTRMDAFATRTGASRETVLETLKKVHTDHNLPKLNGIQRELRDVIWRICPNLQEVTLSELQRVAERLSYLAYEASSLPDDSALTLYMGFEIDPESAAAANVISQKRITRTRIEAELEAIRAEPSLAAADPVPPEDIPADLSTMEKKLTAAGLSATTVASAHDWRASAEHQQRMWAAKYGDSKALDMYHHVGTVVQTECAMAHEQAKDETRGFGADMLGRLRALLGERRRDGDVDLYGSCDEHLLGHAMIRTEQCKVWWSLEFDLNGENA